MLDLTDLLNSISAGTFMLSKPDIILLLIPLIILLGIILAKSFVAIDKKRLADAHFLRSRRRMRIFVFITRMVIFAALFIALAGPYGEVKEEIPGDLTLNLLLDNSSSMELFDTSFVPTLQAELEKRIPVRVAQMTTETESSIGEGMLANLEKDRNVLLITDGRNTKGIQLSDVIVYASSLNSSVSAVTLDEVASDASIVVDGPSKTIADIENVYKAVINRAKKPGDTSLDVVRLVIGVDDEIVFDGVTDRQEFTFSRNFSSGYHRIVARITPVGDGVANDHFPQNNVFYKNTHVVPKPKVLLVSEVQTPLFDILSQLYDTTMTSALPSSQSDLEPYYAVVLNDIPANRLKSIGALSDYVIEGNGLFVIGGFNSFDNGGYKGSAIESLLPVQVGAGDYREGEANIVIVLDISGSFTEKGVATTGLATSKAMAYTVIKDIHEKNKVGVVAFDEWPYLVADIQPLLVSRAQTLDRLERLKGQAGQTDFSAGLKGAFNLLRGKTGSKNVIFISDGYTWNDLIRQNSVDVAKAMKDYGIRIYVIGTGRNLDEVFLKSLASSSGGIYFTVDTSNRLKILFGEAQKKDSGSAFSLFVIDPYHFITEGFEPTAVLYGYNQVTPKQSANLLITTDDGTPALVVWKHGIGRVASLSVFASGNNLGELLNQDNSKLLTRIVNWAIADPERKNDFFVDVPDARVNKSSDIIVRSKSMPRVKGLEFSKIDKNTYRAPYVNDNVGFRSVLGAIYGVNYDLEYQELGFNGEVETMVASTGGKMFSPEQVDEIVEHVKSVSKRTVSQKKDFRDLFIMAALLLFLLEILVRRIRETWFLRR